MNMGTAASLWWSTRSRRSLTGETEPVNGDDVQDQKKRAVFQGPTPADGMIAALHRKETSARPLRAAGHTLHHGGLRKKGTEPGCWRLDPRARAVDPRNMPHVAGRSGLSAALAYQANGTRRYFTLAMYSE